MIKVTDEAKRALKLVDLDGVTVVQVKREYDIDKQLDAGSHATLAANFIEDTKEELANKLTGAVLDNAKIQCGVNDKNVVMQIAVAVLNPAQLSHLIANASVADRAKAKEVLEHFLLISENAKQVALGVEQTDDGKVNPIAAVEMKKENKDGVE